MDYNVNSYSGSSVRTNKLLKNVYIWMAAGLFLTFAVAQGMVKSGLVYALFQQPFLLIGAFVLEFILVIRLSARIQRMSTTQAVLSFALYAALNGLVLSSIFLVYSLGTISKAFLSAALMFGGAAVYAVTTKKDLSSWGSYLFMGLWGIIASSLLNFLFQSAALDYFISFAGVAIFTGLTAYDTQRIKAMGDGADYSDEGVFMKLSIHGALRLYMDFINLFLALLRIFGRRN